MTSHPVGYVINSTDNIYDAGSYDRVLAAQNAEEVEDDQTQIQNKPLNRFVRKIINSRSKSINIAIFDAVN